MAGMPARLGYSEQWASDAGEDVGVLVGVDVGEGDALLLDALDLGEGFARDVGCGDFADEDGEEEVGEGRAEGFAVGAEEGGDGFGRRERDAVGEDDVAADAERGLRVGDADGVVKGRAVGHEGGGGESAGGVQFGDGAIDAGGEAEVVGVEDEARGHRSGVICVVGGSVSKVVAERNSNSTNHLKSASWRF